MMNVEATAGSVAANEQSYNELRQRLCNAEIAAALEKYGMAVSVMRTERMAPGRGIEVEYTFNFVPKPKGNGKAGS